MSAPTSPEQILDAYRGKNSPKMRTLLEEWEKLLLKQAAGSGSIDIVPQLIDHYGTTKVIDQAMLRVAAQKGNVDVFDSFFSSGQTLKSAMMCGPMP
jgi:hypothetical protein